MRTPKINIAGIITAQKMRFDKQPCQIDVSGLGAVLVIDLHHGLAVVVSCKEPPNLRISLNKGSSFSAGLS